MRELKFRAWDPHLNKMICTGFSIIGEVTIFNGLETMISETPVDGVTGLDRLMDLKIMQFTGLVDKNGVNIYESDIVNIDRYDKPLAGEIKQLSGGQYYINHKKASLKYQHQIHCEICSTDSPVFFIDYFESYELEIIANIYEHHKLVNNG